MAKLICIYTLVILTLIWGRFFFFTIRSSSSNKRISLLYDLLVAIQILTTYFCLFTKEHAPVLIQTIAAIGYFLAIAWFVWAIRTAKGLDFAFSDHVGTLITNGPFKVVRHPFYTCYIVIWGTSTILFNSPLLWGSFTALIAFYFISARKEENLILKTNESDKYKLMRKEVGMFIPKATQWRSWILEKSSITPS